MLHVIAFAKLCTTISILAVIIVPSHAFSSSPRSSGPPSWADLERQLPSALAPGPAVYDADDVADEADLKGRTVLYRDRNGRCPHCERAWLALEVKGIDYATVLVEGEDDESPGSSLPRVRWPDGSVNEGASDMLAILERIEEESPGSPNFFPDISVSVDIVRMSIERRFDGVMPRFTRPSVTAPYVYRIDKDAKEGEIVQRFKYQVTLEEIEEILEEYDDGPFIAGDGVTAADIFWAPFLERFAAHLPILHDGLQPRSLQYEAIKDWYDAMDALPCYSCLVKGRGETWRRLLRTEHPDLETIDDAKPPVDIPKKRSFNPKKIWSSFASGKLYLASTPAEEAAARIVRDRAVITEAASVACAALSEDAADEALRELCSALAAWGGKTDGDNGVLAASKLSGNAREVAAFLDGGVKEGFWEVPRDIGVLPAEALRTLVSAAPKPRI